MIKLFDNNEQCQIGILFKFEQVMSTWSLLVTFLKKKCDLLSSNITRYAWQGSWETAFLRCFCPSQVFFTITEVVSSGILKNRRLNTGMRHGCIIKYPTWKKEKASVLMFKIRFFKSAFHCVRYERILKLLYTDKAGFVL